MTSSRANGPRQVPPPPNSRAGVSYARFIPREELQGFSSWTPGAFGEDRRAAERRSADRRAAEAAAAAPTAAGAAEPGVELNSVRQQAEVAAARQSGYQDGYRDGLVALESFKQSYASQVTAQVGAVLHSLDSELGALEQQVAASVARIATQLARQVLGSELASRPEQVVQVAQDAVNAVLMSARHITVLVNPDDHALIAQGAAETLAARGARLVSQPAVHRGGCLVESDVGTIDARIEARWAQATEVLGTEVSWIDQITGDDR
jgi:flagellar assembly protein FliH